MTGAGPLPLVALDRADASIPVLLTGLCSAVVMRADGELHCSLDTRGAPIDWGGVYAQGIRLTGPWERAVTIDGSAVDLPSALVRFEARRWGARAEYRVGEVELTEEITPYATAPAVGRRITFQSAMRGPHDLAVRSWFRPSLAAVIVEGVQPYELELRTGTVGPELRGSGHVAVFESSARDTAWSVNGRPWDRVHSRGEILEVGAQVGHRWTGEIPWTLDLAIAGGSESAFVPSKASTPAFAGDTGREAAAADSWERWDAGCARFSFPDDPALEEAVRLARSAVRALYVAPDATTRGLVAGWPWYCALWCRDLAWMLPAVIWLGDADWAEASLATVFRYQAPDRIPILGAETGELPMEISQGPVFLYGTSDTTLYYPTLVRQFVRTFGRVVVADRWWPNLERVIGWARAKTDPNTGLFTHGGEVLELRDATDSVGSVHLGFDAVDTTIWDSADRRSHAIDLQVLYAQALRATIDLGGHFHHLAETTPLVAKAETVEAAIRDRYWWPEEGYLRDTFAADGTPSPKVRPNALRAVSAGLVPTDRARSVVDRALRDDLATTWGVRTLSSSDPGFAPHAYHEGQVWTIATAWAADAAFAVGDRDRGLAALHTIADRIRAEHGLAHECYRGDRAEPYDSCFLLGFSVAPFVTVVFERLWGLEVNAMEGTLRVAPAFPAGWRSARLEHLRIGDGHADLEWSPRALQVRWSGPGVLAVHFGGRTVAVRGGSSAELAAAAETS